MRLPRFQHLSLLLAALFLLSVAACDQTSVETADAPTVLTVLRPSQEPPLAPGTDDTPKFLTFLPLRDSGWRCWGREAWEQMHGWPPPGLAETIVGSENGRVRTVTLRDDLTWEDGVPVTAQDVKFTIDLWNHPEVQFYGAYAIEDVTILDDRTLRFELSVPGDWIGTAGWYVYYPKHLLEDLPPEEFYEWDFWQHPVGNGPFRVVRNIPDQLLELEPNEGYPDASPDYGLLRVKLTTASRTNELLSEEVDLATMQPAEAVRFHANPEFRTHFDYGWSGTWLIWNLRTPIFDDVRVRRAMAHAVDRQALLAALDLPEDAPITDGQYAPCQFHRDELLPPLEHDRDRARELLEAAGWTDRNDDGVRDRNGSTLAFTALVDERRQPTAVFVQDQLRRIGIRMDIVLQTPASLRDRYGDGDFEATIGRGTGVNLTDLHSNSSPFGYNNPRVDALLERAYDALSWKDQAPAYRKITEITRAELPALYLHPGAQVTVARDRVRNLDALFRSGNMWGLEHLEVHDDR